MMKKQAFIIVLMLVSVASYGQRNGKIILKPGFGILPSFYPSIARLYIPPISLSADLGIPDDFSIGAIVAISGAEVRESNSSFTYTAKYVYFTMAGRLNYYFWREGDLAFYAGGSLGFNTQLSETVTFGTVRGDFVNRPSILAFGFYLGGELYLKNNWGAFGELGWGISPLRVGLTYNLN